MLDDSDNLVDQFIKYMHSQATDPLPKSLIDDNYIGRHVKPLNALDGASFFSGLMLRPELGSNHNRLSALVLAILGYGNGKKKLSRKLAKNLFLSLNNTFYQQMEDPSEDVFISLVYFENNNFKIIQGLWTDNDFYIQIFLNALKDIQPSTRIINLFESIRALLKLSDLMISNSSLERFSLGSKSPLTEIPGVLLNNISQISNKIRFSKEALVVNGINPDDLSVFIYSLSQREELLLSSLGSCPLELKPIVETGENYYVMLPSTIGQALKNLIFKFFISSGNEIALRHLMQSSYLEHFINEISLLGIRNKDAFNPIVNNTGSIIGRSAVIEFDKGRYFQALLLFDDFSGYETSGFSGISPNALESIHFIENEIRSVYQVASELNGFREGMTIIISCGWGRAIALPQIMTHLQNWFTEFISTPDLTMFSNISEMNLIRFWQFIKAKRVAESTGIQINNLSGLLNLYAWAESNNFHIVPHTQLPKELTPSRLGQYLMLIESNFLLDIRTKVRLNWDAHNEISPDGKVIYVKRLGSDSYFDEDKLRPVYASVDDAKNGKLVGLIKSEKINYWNILSLRKDENAFMAHEIWKALCYWIHKLGKILDSDFSLGTHKKVVWRWRLEGVLPTEVQAVPCYEEMLKLAESRSQEENDTLFVTTSFKSGFLQGFHHESNQGERAMINVFLKSLLTCMASPEQSDQISAQILAKIFSNPNAKSFHVLQVLHYRDHMAKNFSKPIYISQLEAGTSKIGLGWLARNTDFSSKIEGISNCTKYLNDLVFNIWLKLKENIQRYNKIALLIELIENHEAIADDTRRWERTFKAVLESHELKENIFHKVTEEIWRRNGSLLGTRILIEIALCESKSDGGIIPGEIDIGEMLVYASLLFGFAGWSDTIKYEMVPAEITISPAGDVLLDHTFNDSVVEPYGRISQENVLKNAIKSYSDYFQTTSKNKDPLVFEEPFNNAWIEEYGFSIDEGASVIDAIFQIGINKSKLVFIIDEEELVESLESKDISRTVLLKFLELFTLSERADWLTAPQGFNVNDIFPWKFRRRLSVVVRPILKLGAKLIITPGLLMDGFEYLVISSLQASFDENFYSSKLMRSWIGGKRNVAGHKFNKDVATAFISRGWKAEAELKLTKLLNKKLDRDYGDIDVVAWNLDSGEILLIECKDLEFAKNQSEISKQIYEFRGMKRENGKPDRLLKHMERIRMVNNNIEALRDYIGVENEIIITPCLLFSRLVPIKFLISENLKMFKVFLYDDLSLINVSEHDENKKNQTI